MLSNKDMFERMAKGWRGGLEEGTTCGQGSLHRNVDKIVAWLPKIVAKYSIDTVCDAGAGDLHWIPRVDWAVDYQAFDLIPRHPDVQKLDITTQALPPCDAILCRMVLNHLFGENDATRIEMALALFQESADYLIATHFTDGINRTRQFQRLDLTKYLGQPLDMTVDGHEPGCHLAIWGF